MTCPSPIIGSDHSGVLDYHPTQAYSTVVSDGSYNAFPGLCIPDLSGCRLMVVYRKGSAHLSGDGRTVMRTSTDVGLTWSAETTLYNPVDPTADDARDTEIVRLSNGTLLVNLFVANNGLPIRKLVLISSTDSGSTWNVDESIGDGGYTDFVACSGKILELPSGDLIWPIYGRNSGDAYDSAAILFSSDGGATWGSKVTTADGPANSRSWNEHTVVRLRDGTLVDFLRTDTSPVSLYRAESTDNGLHWSTPTAVFNDHGSGRPAPLVLVSGGIHTGFRLNSPSANAYFATSWDDGLTWTETATAFWAKAQHYASGIEIIQGVIGFVVAGEITGGSVADIRFQLFVESGNPPPLRVHQRNDSIWTSRLRVGSTARRNTPRVGGNSFI